MSERRAQIHTEHALSKTRRCQLLAVARSTAYYRPEALDEGDLALMRLTDEIHLEWQKPPERRPPVARCSVSCARCSAPSVSITPSSCLNSCACISASSLLHRSG